MADSPQRKQPKKQRKETKATLEDDTEKSKAFYEYFVEQGALDADHACIVYSDKYNITFFHLEKLHPFVRK